MHAFINIRIVKSVAKCLYCSHRIGTKICVLDQYWVKSFRVVRVAPVQSIDVCNLIDYNDSFRTAHFHRPVYVFSDQATEQPVPICLSVNFRLGSMQFFTCPFGRSVDRLLPPYACGTPCEDSIESSIDSQCIENIGASSGNMDDFDRLFEQALQNEPCSSRGTYSVESIRRAMTNARIRFESAQPSVLTSEIGHVGPETDIRPHISHILKNGIPANIVAVHSDHSYSSPVRDDPSPVSTIQNESDICVPDENVNFGVGFSTDVDMSTVVGELLGSSNEQVKYISMFMHRMLS